MLVSALFGFAAFCFLLLRSLFGFVAFRLNELIDSFFGFAILFSTLMGGLIGIAAFCWAGDISVGIAEAKLVKMVADMSADSCSSLAGITEAEPAEMAAKMAGACAN